MNEITQELHDKIVTLHDEGFSAAKIAQKTRTKKAVVVEVLGSAAKDGIGSDIEVITEATGIKAVAEKVADVLGADDCGCAARAEKLNKIFPRRKTNDLSNEDYRLLQDFFKVKVSSVNTPTQKMLVDIYNRVFNGKRQVSNCGVCVANIIKELKRIFDAV